MTKILPLFLLLLLSFGLRAEEIRSKIHSYHPQLGMLKLENGRVVYTAGPLAQEFVPGTEVRIQVSDDLELLQIEALAPTSGQPLTQAYLTNSPPSFGPTLLNSEVQVQQVFERLNPGFRKGSECSDRAHIWAFEEYQHHGIESEKAFIFFTDRYISSQRFKWWFHVAPMVNVQGRTSAERRVLDFTFAQGPLSPEDWSRLLVYSGRGCPVIERYADYQRSSDEDCYLLFESMYYRLPLQLARRETMGQYRHGFSSSEINFARSMGFE
jgi:hypothetical protein